MLGMNRKSAEPPREEQPLDEPLLNATRLDDEVRTVLFQDAMRQILPCKPCTSPQERRRAVQDWLLSLEKGGILKHDEVVEYFAKFMNPDYLH